MANLSEMTNEQREQHRMAVCMAIGLSPDPALGLLDYIWMLQENGMNNLVLYAKRGALELVRDIQGIDIKSLEQHDGPGYVSFKATAVNKKGRQEIAVGAHEIEGLKGKKLADAIATAQTRALRRVTLQFAGHGILDESEVTVVPANIAAPAASGAQLAGSPAVIPPPTVAPSTAPGKDVTESVNSLVDQKTNIVQVYEEGAKALADMKPATERYSDAQNPPIQGVSLQQIADIKADIPAEEVKKKRKYTRRNQVDLSSPGQPVQIEMPVGHIDSHGAITVPVITNATISVPPATANEPEQAAIGNGQGLLPALAEPASPSADIPKSQPSATLAPEKAKEFRDRLNKYSSDILPREGGMLPSEGIGGSTMKLRKFAMIYLGLSGSNANLSQEQFEDILNFVDDYYQKNGAKSLVEYINKSIGAK